MGGLAAWMFSLASDAEADARRNGGEDRSGQLLFWGVADAVFGVGLLGYGIADLATSPDPTAMQRYYRDTYPTR
jgi:hypothetical protein